MSSRIAKYVLYALIDTGFWIGLYVLLTYQHPLVSLAC